MPNSQTCSKLPLVLQPRSLMRYGIMGALRLNNRLRYVSRKCGKSWGKNDNVLILLHSNQWSSSFDL